jgi:hypothetical protein
MPDATSKNWDAWNRGTRMAAQTEPVGLTRSDVRRGLELEEAEERGRRRGYVQAGRDALAAVRDASLLDRVRGGDPLDSVIRNGMREREEDRRRQLPPGSGPGRG